MDEASDVVDPRGNSTLTEVISINRRFALGAIAGAAVASTQMFGETRAFGAAARNLAEQLSDYVAGIEFMALDETTVEIAKSLLIDAIGCGIAAYQEKPVRAAREVALTVPGGINDCSVKFYPAQGMTLTAISAASGSGSLGGA